MEKIKKLQRKYFTVIFACGTAFLYLISIFYFVKFYFGEYNQLAAYNFQYGYKQALHIAKDQLRTANRLIVTQKYGQPYIFTLLYFRYSPEAFQQGALENVQFVDFSWPNLEADTVFVATPEEIPPDDPAVIEVVTIPGTEEIVFVIARNKKTL